MTCIVWSKGVLATDRNVSYADTNYSDREELKIYKASNYVIGFSGPNYIRKLLISYIESNFAIENKTQFSNNEDFEAIIINPTERKLLKIEKNFDLEEYPYDYDLTIGSLGLFAKGALIMGANAIEAVETALKSFKLRPEAKFLTVDSIVLSF